MRIIRYLSITMLVGVLIGIGMPPAQAADWWQPSSSTPLALHWNLDTGTGDGPINVNDPWHVGERSLSGGVLPRPAVLDIDGDYNTRTIDPADTSHVSRGVVETLHARGQRVICYMDAGVQEMNDAATVFDREAPYRFPTDRQAERSDWGGYWIDFTEPGNGTTAPDPRVLAVMQKRMVEWCKPGTDPAAWFDAVELDEVDYWENKGSGFPDVTYQSQLAYNRALYDMAHSLGLAVIHKGDLAQIRDLEPWADATLNEEAGQYRELLDEYNPNTGQTCTESQPAHLDNTCGVRVFSSKGKAVWNAEYKATAFNRSCTTYQPAKWRINVTQFRLGLPATGGRKPCPATW